jgi:hypothetical protein
MEAKTKNKTLPNSAEMQLTKLSSVLNGLEHGASAMRRHAMQAMQAVKSGTYTIDASAVSRSIIGDCVGYGVRSGSAGGTPPKIRAGAKRKPRS